MLEAAALSGHTSPFMVEQNKTALDLSSSNHKRICGDAGDFVNYTNLPDCDALLGGPPCQSFGRNGAKAGEGCANGVLSALIPVVTWFLGCSRFIMESVVQIDSMIASHNTLRNLLSLAKACGFHTSQCSVQLGQCWIQCRTRLIVVGSITLIPPTFSQTIGPSPCLAGLPILDWRTPLEQLPEECWPTEDELILIHSPSRVPA